MSDYQKKWGIRLLIFWVVGWMLAAEVARANEPAGDRGKEVDVALWLARSIVGECGWKCVDTGEAAAIAWIYHKRSYNHNGRNYFRAMVDYSAALRVGLKTRPWLRHLKRSGERPAMLETNVAWGHHLPLWIKTLEFADKFFAGQVPDPAVKALHFGGVMDIVNMDPKVWKQMDLPFRNKLFRKRDEPTVD